MIKVGDFVVSHRGNYYQVKGFSGSVPIGRSLSWSVTMQLHMTFPFKKVDAKVAKQLQKLAK
jgi:hypothetical protein